MFFGGCNTVCRATPYATHYTEGVLYAEKDFTMENHPEIEVPNLEVIKLMQSFVSHGYVKELFAWRHYYWYVVS